VANTTNHIGYYKMTKYSAEEAMQDIIAILITSQDSGQQGEYIIYNKAKQLDEIGDKVYAYQMSIINNKKPVIL